VRADQQVELGDGLQATGGRRIRYGWTVPEIVRAGDWRRAHFEPDRAKIGHMGHPTSPPTRPPPGKIASALSAAFGPDRPIVESMGERAARVRRLAKTA
jgi:hypothetical protein